MQLGGATWPEVAATGGSCLLAVPVGSLEQHGPHLPLNTDTRIAVELATRLAVARRDVVVAPAVAYGASGEHAAFPGTLLINHGVLADLLLELVRSARDCVRRRRPDLGPRWQPRRAGTARRAVPGRR